MIGHPLMVRELLDAVARGQVLLPELQRAYAWKGPQVAKLIHPARSPSTLVSSESPRARSRPPRSDGPQRDSVGEP
jgi:hypothetical protein